MPREIANVFQRLEKVAREWVVADAVVVEPVSVASLAQHTLTLLDVLRRAQVDALGAFGLGPTEALWTHQSATTAVRDDPFAAMLNVAYSFIRRVAYLFGRSP